MYTIRPIEHIQAEINVPADKSISHRSIITSSIACGKTFIEPFLVSEDTLATLACVEKCGIKTKREGGSLTIEGKGRYFPAAGKISLFARESGTTMRIVSGVLCGQKGAAFKFNAADSLLKRPMSRITQPLRMMGADIKGVFSNTEEYPPLDISAVKELKPVKYSMPLASAQVQSSLIYASLYARGVTEIREPFLSRDHTERMLSIFGMKLRRRGKTIISGGSAELNSPGELFIPGDFSSAAFFIVLGIILRNSRLVINKVNINPTRCGLLSVLRKMGGQIKVVRKKNYYEPYADIAVESSQLRAAEVTEKEIPLMIDEIPVLAAAASRAKGVTRIWGIGELRVKETDRISSMVYNLNKAGVKAEAKKYVKNKKENWMLEIEGAKKLKAENFKSFSDHRTAMSMIVLAKSLEGVSCIDDVACIDKSFPQFIALMNSL